MDKEPFGILWDMDGVLFDTVEEHYHSWSEVLPEYNIPLNREIFESVFGMKNEAAIARLAGRQLPPEVVIEISGRKEQAFRQYVRGNIHPLPGVRAWLEKFQAWGYPQALASSAPPENIDVMLAEAGIRKYFSAVVAADGLPSKPDPAIYQAAAGLIGVPAGRCIVMEDAIWGVAGAKRAGMLCIAVTTSHPAEALLEADMVVERLDMLTPEDFQRLTASRDAEQADA